MTETTDALATLHTRLVDAREGYAEGRKLAEAPLMIAALDRLLALHGAHADDIAQALIARGLTPENDGSFLQYVHKAVLNVRSALTGLGENVIPGLVDGERRILDLYDDASADVGSDAELRALLERQRAAVASSVRDLESMERAADARRATRGSGAGRPG